MKYFFRIMERFIRFHCLILVDKIYHLTRGELEMHRYFKVVVLVLLVTLSLQQVAFATNTTQPRKPTEGVASLDPKHGSSLDTEGITTESIGLITGYGCSIDNKGSSLFLSGTTTASYIVEKVSLTLYIQKWDSTKWVDVKSFSYNSFNAKSITDGDYIYSFDRQSYYRTRAVHYAKDGLETDTQNSESSYIYVN